MKKPWKNRGLHFQISIMILAGILVAAVITYISQYKLSEVDVVRTTGEKAEAAGLEMISAIKEYRSYEWLMPYWQEHADELDVEYDADFGAGTLTEKKQMRFRELHPNLPIRYLQLGEIEKLPEEDKQLYAEITYSWILTRVDEIKRNTDCDYLFLVTTGAPESDHPFEEQVFLMSAADKGDIRGTNYEEFYTLGVTTPVQENSSLKSSMEDAVNVFTTDGPDRKYISREKVSDASNYLDYYLCFDIIGDTAYMIGVTYDMNTLKTEIRNNTLRTTLISAGYQFLALQLVMLSVLFLMINPLKKVLEKIRKYTKERDGEAARKEMAEILSAGYAVAVRQDEIGQLAGDFSNLTLEIDDYVEQITKFTSQKERYETELNIAADIQTQVLPKDFPAFPDRKEFDLHATTAPAREVGGDFYDFFFVDQDHIALVIGDVSDKGVPAALFMMITKTLIKDHAKMGESPTEILTHVNDVLSESNDARFFVTVWLALIDLRTGDGMVVNAGHEHPAVCPAGGSYELKKYKHDLFVGALQGVKYTEHTFHMDPGDSFFVYTDGVPEAVNENNEQFGTGRMLEVLDRNRDAAPGELLEKMKEAIDDFSGETPRFDDTTMLYFRYNGAEK